MDAEHIRDKILNQEIPYCERCKVNEASEVEPRTECEAAEPKEDQSTEEALAYKKNNSAGILKPDIVFFGEGLPELYHKSIGEDKDKCDLLIVIGSSLKVKPVANIPHTLPQNIPQILINRESLKHLNFDIELLGDCDVIVNELLLRLEKKQLAKSKTQTAADLEANVSWSDLCKSTAMLKEIAGEEAENLLFPKRSGDDQSECSSSSLDNSTVIFGDLNKKEEVAKAEKGEASKDTVTEPKSGELMSLNNKEYAKDYLKEGSFLYLKPNMYIFHGAEVQLRYTRKKLSKLNKKYAEEDGVAKNGVSEDEDDDSYESSDETTDETTEDSEDGDEDELTDDGEDDEVCFNFEFFKMMFKSRFQDQLKSIE